MRPLSLKYQDSILEPAFRHAYALEVMKREKWCDQDDWTLFLDRDGVLNRRIVGGYVTRPKEFEFLPGVKTALAFLQQKFKYLIVVTNQQGIGKGLMSEQDLKAVHRFMSRDLETVNVRLDAVLYCPGLAANNPDCRKPNRGMADEAVKLFPDISLYHSIMVGDAPSDIGFAKNAGCKSVLCGQSNWRVLEHFNPMPDIYCKDLKEFSDLIKMHLS